MGSLTVEQRLALLAGGDVTERHDSPYDGAAFAQRGADILHGARCTGCGGRLRSSGSDRPDTPPRETASRRLWYDAGWCALTDHSRPRGHTPGGALP